MRLSEINNIIPTLRKQSKMILLYSAERAEWGVGISSQSIQRQNPLTYMMWGNIKKMEPEGVHDQDEFEDTRPPQITFYVTFDYESEQLRIQKLGEHEVWTCPEPLTDTKHPLELNKLINALVDFLKANIYEVR